MIVTCYNCKGWRYVWNGWRNLACPLCGGRGEFTRVIQPDLFGGPELVYRSIIKPDAPRSRRI